MEVNLFAPQRRVYRGFHNLELPKFYHRNINKEERQWH
jgi:hypothetical protein